MSGYDIQKSCREFLGHFWGESFGQIYPMLKQLETQGAVAVMAGPEPDNRNRKVYRITGKGRLLLREWLQDPPAPPTSRDELLLKLSCGHEAGRDVHIRYLEEAREEARKRLQEFVKLEITYLADYRTAPDLPYWLITLKAGKVSWEARMRWCEDSIASLKSMKRSTDASGG